MHEAGNHKECWYSRMKDKGLRVKIAENDKGESCGMIQYLPVELSQVEGHDLYFVLCIWVHGHRKGVGNFQKRGLGKALLQAAEADVRQLGGKGLVTWGLILPFFMRAGWYKKQGYRVVDKSGLMRLLWKPFTTDAEPPRNYEEKKLPGGSPGKVSVSVFLNGWCPAQNIVYERVKKAVIEFREKVEFNVYRTADHDILKYWGISDALFIDRRRISTGPAPSYRRIHRLIEGRVRKLREQITI